MDEMQAEMHYSPSVAIFLQICLKILIRLNRNISDTPNDCDIGVNLVDFQNSGRGVRSVVHPLYKWCECRIYNYKSAYLRLSRGP
jgi:hypothetical protein